MRSYLKGFIFLPVLAIFSMYLRAESLIYKGINTEVDLVGLVPMFPKSNHRFWFPSGKSISPAQGLKKFEESIKSNRGQYSISLSREESFDGIYRISSVPLT